jgi:hypothetical protein
LKGTQTKWYIVSHYKWEKKTFQTFYSNHICFERKSDPNEKEDGDLKVPNAKA